MAPLFELRAVSFAYEEIQALRSLSFQIEPGERVALVGSNGCGKSTLLHLLDGLQFAATGSLHFLSHTLTPQAFRNDEFATGFRRRVAMVFQNPDVQLFNPTVFEEVTYGPLHMGWTHDEVVRRVEDVLAFMEISHLRDRPPYRLSGGEKKRVSLASVLVLDPEVLLLDEPTATLDPKSQSHLIDLIQQWKGSAKTVITATHQLDIVEDVADRVLVLEEGSLIESGTPEEILSDNELLLRANLVHAHRHSHGTVSHSHPHIHRHGHDHRHEPGD